MEISEPAPEFCLTPEQVAQTKTGKDQAIEERYNPSFAVVFILLRPRTGALRDA